MLRACIFDLDGTLANTLTSMAVVANEVLSEVGLPALPEDNFRYYCGEGAAMLVRRCLVAAGDTELVHFAEVQRRYRERFNQNPMVGVKAYPGIPEALEALRLSGAKLAVLTNKPDPAAQQVVRELFGSAFDLVLGQQEGLQRKPSPEGAQRIAIALGVAPEECLYIGDTATDMKTGRAAGMTTAGVLWGFRDQKELEDGGAQLLAHTPEDLMRFYLLG